MRMGKIKPLILSIIGKSDSGKTTLILRLLPELKQRGLKVAVAKHCPCGFDLDIKGKDSWKFTQAGADATFLSSDKHEALIRPKDGLSSINERLQNYFSDFDIVLMEGYTNEPGIKKIQIIRKGIGAMDISSEEVVAYISDTTSDTDNPVYNLNDISGIISFIITLRQNQQIEE